MECNDSVHKGCLWFFWQTEKYAIEIPVSPDPNLISKQNMSSDLTSVIQMYSTEMSS